MIQKMNYKIKCRNLHMKPPLSLLLENLVKLSKVVKEGTRDAKMVGFHFNIIYLFLFRSHLHPCCLWLKALSHSFFFCEKFIPRFIISFVVMGALKYSEKLYLQQVLVVMLYYGVGKGFFSYYGLLVSFTAFFAILTSFSSFLDQILFFIFFFTSFGYKFSTLPMF